MHQDRPSKYAAPGRKELLICKSEQLNPELFRALIRTIKRMSYWTVLLVLAAVAISHCFYLAAWLFLLNAKLANRILACMLLVLAIRTGKSVVALLFPETAYWVSILGLMAMALVGPLILLYTLGLFTTEARPAKRSWAHLAPALSTLVLFVTLNWTLMTVLYYFFTAHMLFYICWSGIHLSANRQIYGVDDLRWKWAWAIVAGHALVWISFVVQMIFYDPVTYTVNVVVACIVVFLLSLFAVSRAKLFTADPKRKTGLSEEHDELAKRIHGLLEEEIFVDPNLNISRLAERLKSPAYLVSRTINQHFRKSFSELIMGYRIRKAEQLLLPRSQVLSIEGIAYESGFNSLSAFYNAFKRINKMTPAQFRNQGSQASMKIA
jgi:AraC-like DNA-binding protein